MGMINFRAGTLAQYTAATKSQDTLYFITDAKRIYKGDTDVTTDVYVVTAYDTADTGAIALADAYEGKLYINATTFEVRIKNGNAWSILSPGYVSDGTSFANANNNSKMATIGAIKAYITQQISDITGGTAFVKGITWDSTNHNLLIDKGEEQPTSLALTGLVYDPFYDENNLQIRLPRINDDAILVNLPKDNFVRNGRYEGSYTWTDTSVTPNVTHTNEPALVLTVNNGTSGATDTEVVIPAANLVNDYTGTSTGIIPITINSNTHAISATLTVDPATNNALTTSASGAAVLVNQDANNALEKTNTGLKVNIDNKANKLTSAAENHVLKADSTGDIADSYAIIGGSTLPSSAPATTTLATEQAIINALSWNTP